MKRLIPLLFLFPLSSITRAQGTIIESHFDDAVTAIGNSQIIEQSESSEAVKSTTPISILSDKREALYQNIAETIDIEKKMNTGYAARIDITWLFKPEHPLSEINSESGIMLGLKKPYYRLFPDIRVIGTMDLRLNKEIAGIENTAVITIRYDFARPRTTGKYKSDLSIFNIVCKVSIPINIP